MLIGSLANRKVDTSNNADSNLKSFAKTVSWRIVGTLDTIVISYLITGSTSMAFSIGSIEVITKMVLYYFHERVWNQIRVGR